MDKPWVKNHPIFSYDHIGEFYEMFILYADPRTKKADVRDILVTAKTLGLTDKFPIIAHALDDLAASYDDVVDFEKFIADLTAKLVIKFLIFLREIHLINKEEFNYSI